MVTQQIYAMNTIPCPHCGKNVEISQAFRHQIEEQVLIDVKAKHTKELEELKKEVEEKAVKQVKETFALTLKDSQNEAKEQAERNKTLNDQLLSLTKQLRLMQQKDSEREIEMEKKLLKEREILQRNITEQVTQKITLEKLELQKQLDDTKKALEEAQKKAQQQSQQLQGEVLEQSFEQELFAMFPTDEILPVPKGIEGADIWQKIRNKHGQEAGSILWEMKRTKTWSGSWTGKLRDDIRKVGASTGIIVSNILPDSINTFGFYESVWVTSYTYAVGLVSVLRIGLFQVAIAKSAAANKDSKLEMLFSYLTDNTFRHRFEAQVESIVALNADLEAEQRSTIRLWKKREMQIARMKNNLASMYGELQGILGSALPTIPQLEGPVLPLTSQQADLLE
jgi:hypothetical protein